jgi:hypothetical protein
MKEKNPVICLSFHFRPGIRHPNSFWVFSIRNGFLGIPALLECGISGGACFDSGFFPRTNLVEAD